VQITVDVPERLAEKLALTSDLTKQPADLLLLEALRSWFARERGPTELLEMLCRELLSEMVATNDSKVAESRYREFVEAVSIRELLLHRLRAIDERTLPQLLDKLERELQRVRSRVPPAAPMSLAQLREVAERARAAAAACRDWMKILDEIRCEWKAKEERALEAGEEELAREARSYAEGMASKLRVAERQLEMHLAHAELIEHGISLITT
jgi:hypothetical protein